MDFFGWQIRTLKCWCKGSAVPGIPCQSACHHQVSLRLFHDFIGEILGPLSDHQQYECDKREKSMSSQNLDVFVFIDLK